jgi:hypothetical protein
MAGNIRDFRFRGMEGRGTPRLVQEPGSRNYYVAVVNVQDPRGGDERYKFELSWDWDGAGGGGIFPDRPTTRPTPPSGDGIFDGGSNALPDMNMSTMGNGSLDDGTQRYGLIEASVRVRGDKCQITLITDRRQRLEMTGRVSRGSPRCLINSSNRGSTSANAYIHMEGNRVARVNVSGNINGRNFTSDFNSR